MRKQLKQVGEFHQQIGAEIAASPTLLRHRGHSATLLAKALRQVHDQFMTASSQTESLVTRTLLSLEETIEWLEAHARNDIDAAADAWADRCYALLGDALATGIPAEVVFDEVHRSNMTKFARDPVTGKAVKASGYQRPHIKVSGLPPRIDRS